MYYAAALRIRGTIAINYTTDVGTTGLLPTEDEKEGIRAYLKIAKHSAIDANVGII